MLIEEFEKKKNIHRVTEQPINTRMRVVHVIIISVVWSRVEYFSIFKFFDLAIHCMTLVNVFLMKLKLKLLETKSLSTHSQFVLIRSHRRLAT